MFQKKRPANDPNKVKEYEGAVSDLKLAKKWVEGQGTGHKSNGNMTWGQAILRGMASYHAPPFQTKVL